MIQTDGFSANFYRAMGEAGFANKAELLADICHYSTSKYLPNFRLEGRLSDRNKLG